MKFPVTLTAALALLLPSTLACLNSFGEVTTTGSVISIIITDNGEVVCNSAWGWRIDQDNHYSLSCLANYIFAVTQDGEMAWYRNPVTAFSWTQSAAGDLDEITWNENHFC